MKLRIQFTKHGAMKFIGHLDTMRFFQRAIRRSGIDIAYTGGFSPHPIMTFAQPLGVGIQSDSEILDIEVNSFDIVLAAAIEAAHHNPDPDEIYSARQQMIDVLSAQMSEGFSIRDIRLLPENSNNAMASVAAAAYSVELPEEGCAGVDLGEAVRRINSSEEVTVIKKTKKSEAQVDIRPRIYDLSYTDDRVRMCVDASSAGNIKPELVISAMYGIVGEEYPEMRLNVTRNEIYGRNDSDELKPLIEFGCYF